MKLPKIPRRKVRRAGAAILEVAGLVAIAIAGWLVTPALGVFLGGCALVLLAQGVETPPPPDPPARNGSRPAIAARTPEDWSNG